LIVARFGAAEGIEDIARLLVEAHEERAVDVVLAASSLDDLTG
jgi:hypothetical protein